MTIVKSDSGCLKAF